MDMDVLYSNDILLKKYNKEIPKTWDELLKTSKYILEKEKINNSKLIKYNGLFDGKLKNIIYKIYLLYLKLKKKKKKKKNYNYNYFKK